MQSSSAIHTNLSPQFSHKITFLAKSWLGGAIYSVTTFLIMCVPKLEWQTDGYVEMQNVSSSFVQKTVWWTLLGVICSSDRILPQSSNLAANVDFGKMSYWFSTYFDILRHIGWSANYLSCQMMILDLASHGICDKLNAIRDLSRCYKEFTSIKMIKVIQALMQASHQDVTFPYRKVIILITS